MPRRLNAFLRYSILELMKSASGMNSFFSPSTTSSAIFAGSSAMEPSRLANHSPIFLNHPASFSSREPNQSRMSPNQPESFADRLEKRLEIPSITLEGISLTAATTRPNQSVTLDSQPQPEGLSPSVSEPPPSVGPPVEPAEPEKKFRKSFHILC